MNENIKLALHDLRASYDEYKVKTEKFDERYNDLENLFIKTGNYKNSSKVVFLGRKGSKKSDLVSELIKFSVIDINLKSIKFIEYNLCNEDNSYKLTNSSNSQFYNHDEFKLFLNNNYSELDPCLKLSLPKSQNSVLNTITVFDTPFYNYSDELDNEIVEKCKDANIFVIVLSAVGSIGDIDKGFLTQISKNTFVNRLIFIFTNMENVSERDLKSVQRQHESNAHRIANEILRVKQTNIPIFFVGNNELNIVKFLPHLEHFNLTSDDKEDICKNVRKILEKLQKLIEDEQTKIYNRIETLNENNNENKGNINEISQNEKNEISQNENTNENKENNNEIFQNENTNENKGNNNEISQNENTNENKGNNNEISQSENTNENKENNEVSQNENSAELYSRKLLIQDLRYKFEKPKSELKKTEKKMNGKNEKPKKLKVIIKDIKEVMKKSESEINKDLKRFNMKRKKVIREIIKDINKIINERLSENNEIPEKILSIIHKFINLFDGYINKFDVDQVRSLSIEYDKLVEFANKNIDIDRKLFDRISILLVDIELELLLILNYFRKCEKQNCEETLKFILSKISCSKIQNVKLLAIDHQVVEKPIIHNQNDFVPDKSNEILLEKIKIIKILISVDRNEIFGNVGN